MASLLAVASTAVVRVIPDANWLQMRLVDDRVNVVVAGVAVVGFSRIYMEQMQRGGMQPSV